MPQHIKVALQGMIRDFIWKEGVTPRIALKHLYKPLEEGGLNLLNINARNEAIELIWLKSYLNLSPSRPAWAIVTNILISAAAPLGTSAVVRTNSFLQKWKPTMRGLRAEKLGDDIR
ncbi:hypothetical protein EDB89DRAFT_1901864 [Lactarius sanguifluus]|nr:hypothetical protein EDB89DRAFT_1901864 [Lactarius sanguifluus]